MKKKNKGKTGKKLLLTAEKIRDLDKPLDSVAGGLVDHCNSSATNSFSISR